ncbi:F-box domain-containing protein [Mycena indigotica]|uniref:F-box domain-containing protein n=1 Tax=Mycena indigotica TaxID=2126181 RepID=A0A8H6SRM1_9AGAR|nr:F-box domain-containing protein [Mycena indigotica]KAF7303938.1 F-box domain-containing protein [Mycena indigotica]
MPLLTIATEVLLLICEELTIEDVLSLRLTCHSLATLTQMKILWTRRLTEYVHNWAHIARYRQLDARDVELVIRRLAVLRQQKLTGDLTPARTWRHHVGQRIRWLGLARSRWLFVAASDGDISKIACWDLARVFKGNEDDAPLATAFLPSQVHTARMEEHGTTAVLALGLMDPVVALNVVSFELGAERATFNSIRVFPESSHVLFLEGRLVGCAIRNGANEPHVVDWVAGDVLAAERPPSPMAIPGQRSVPHLMATFNNNLLLVVIRSETVEVYRRYADGYAFHTCLRCVPPIWEIVRPLGQTAALQFVALTEHGVARLTIESNDEFCRDIRLCNTLLYPIPVATCDVSFDPQAFRIHVGRAAREVMWMSPSPAWSWGYSITGKEAPTIVVASLPTDLPVDVEDDHKMALDGFKISWSDKSPHAPAFWGTPCLDLDEDAGLTVLGTCFGELAVYDHPGRYGQLPPSLRLPAPECKTLAFQNAGVLPIHPIFLGIPPGPTLRMSVDQLARSRAVQWAGDAFVAEVDPLWGTAARFQPAPHPPMEHYDSTPSGRFWDQDTWAGGPCDNAWWLAEAYGFPGTVLPQAFRDESADGGDTFFLVLRLRITNADPDAGPLFVATMSTSSLEEYEFCAVLAQGIDWGTESEIDEYLFRHRAASGTESQLRPTALAERRAYLLGMRTHSGWQRKNKLVKACA